MGGRGTYLLRMHPGLHCPLAPSPSPLYQVLYGVLRRCSGRIGLPVCLTYPARSPTLL